VRLENKVAVVTGSASGIGEAIALAFAANGAAVVVNYARQEDAAQKVLEMIEDAGGKGLVVGADVSDPKEVEAMIQQATDAFGRLDIMVNNGGLERKMPFLETCGRRPSPSTSRAHGSAARLRQSGWLPR
jgi:NAD(P)-dependent dehydrogenase (short-subunit alcohol dehydrogenase family)